MFRKIIIFVVICCTMIFLLGGCCQDAPVGQDDIRWRLEGKIPPGGPNLPEPPTFP